MTRIILVNPPIPSRGRTLRLLEGGARPVPQRLATLAAVARQSGHQAGILDAQVLGIGLTESARRVLRSAADVVLLTAETSTIGAAADVAQAIRDAKSPMLILLEGPHVSACPEETLVRHRQIDAGIPAESEQVLEALLSAWEPGEALPEVPGLAWRRSGRIHQTRPPEILHDLDQLPTPAWDLLPPLHRRYRPRADEILRWPALGLRTSRGCPGSCLFCDRGQLGRTIRAFSAGYVETLLEELLDRYGMRHVFFDEDAFLYLTERMQELMERLRTRRWPLTWGIRGRPDRISPAWIPSAVDAGLRHVSLEIESGSQQILDLMRKGYRVEQAEEAVRRLREAGIAVTGIFLLGSFGETRETLEESLELIRRLPLTGLVVNWLAPRPGSDAYVMAPRYGKHDPSWRRADPLAAESFVPHGLTPAEVDAARRRAYRLFLLRAGGLGRQLRTVLLRPRVGLRTLRPLLAGLSYGWGGGR